MKRLLLLLLSLPFATACNGPNGGGMNFRHNKDGKGTKVATFGEDSVTAEELKQRYLEMSPFARARYQTLEQKKEFVDSMARFELVAAEAVRRGLHNEPEVVEAAKKVMVQKLLQKELDEKPTPLPENAVAEYYEKHKSDYVKPEMVRLSHLFLAAPKADAAARQTKKAKAQELLAKAKALQPMDFAGFGALVRESSEEPRTKLLEGDLRYLSLEELKTQYGPEVAQAAGTVSGAGGATGLTQVGQLSEVVETEQGFHILKLQGRQAALNLSVEQVRTQIQNILLHEQRMKRYAAFLDELTKKAGYKVDDAALSKVEVDLKAPTQEPKGPPPGMIPAPNAAPGFVQ